MDYYLRPKTQYCNSPCLSVQIGSSQTRNLAPKTASRGAIQSGSAIVPASYQTQELVLMKTPLERAQAKCEQLERELRRSPDFHLYLLTKSLRDRARMESVLMDIPQFALWRTLTRSVESVEASDRV